MSRSLLATSILGLMVVGYIITYPFDSFLGSLLNHGFLAAVIGGLADWFGVTALFRKPFIQRFYLVIVSVLWMKLLIL